MNTEEACPQVNMKEMPSSNNPPENDPQNNSDGYVQVKPAGEDSKDCPAKGGAEELSPAESSAAKQPDLSTPTQPNAANETSQKSAAVRAETGEGSIAEAEMEGTHEKTSSADSTVTKNASNPAPAFGGESDSDNEAGAFELLRSRRRKAKKKSKPTKSIPISITSSAPSSKDSQVEDEPKEDKPATLNTLVKGLVEEEEEICYDFDWEDPESEHDQVEEAPPPVEDLQTKLAKFQAEKDADLAKIKAFLKAKGAERSEQVQMEVNKIRGEMFAKQERQRTQLAENHRRQLLADEKKVEEGLEWLAAQQKIEIEKKMAIHKEESQQGLSQEKMVQWNQFMAQLQTRHQQQIRQFEGKKHDLRKKSEQEVKVQSTILSTHHKKRQAETERHAEELVMQCKQTQEQMKAKLLRLHKERFEHKLKGIQQQRLHEVSKAHDSAHGNAATSDAASSHDSRPKPYDTSISHHAVTRHKRRKISTNSAPFGMSVETHNEGIIVMTRSPDTDHSSSASRMSEFIPWSLKARKLLYTVLSGALPEQFTNLYFSGKKDLDGGLVRCMITDCRTSEDTAICDRAAAFIDHLASKNEAEIDQLTQQHAAMKRQISDLSSEYKTVVKHEEMAVAHGKEAAHAHELSRQTWAKFKAQAQHFFKEDGSMSNTVSGHNQHKLLIAMHKYKEDFEATKMRMNDLQKPLEGAKVATLTKRMELEKLKEQVSDVDARLKKLKRGASRRGSGSLFKSDIAAHSPGEDTSSRIDSVISTIHLTADKRRSIVNQKKTNSKVCSLWGTKMDEHEVDSSTKKSLWQKMQRKRINTVLRPSHCSIVKNLVAETKSSSRTNCFDMNTGDTSIDPAIRAEELLLLALHPETPTDSHPTIPTEEPGWRLCLDTPQDTARNKSSILPMDREGLVSQSFLSVCCSTGRQASSFLEPYHLRTLCDDAPLAFSSKASLLAESNPTCHEKATADMKNTDPLTESEERIELGYSFIVRDIKKKRAAAKSSVGGDSKSKAKALSKKEKSSKATKVSKTAPIKSKPTTTKRKIEKPPKKTKLTPSKDSSSAQDQKQKKSRKKSNTVQPQQEQKTSQPLGGPIIQQPVTLLDLQNTERNRTLQKNNQPVMNQNNKPTEQTSQPNLQQQQQQQQPNLQQQQQPNQQQMQRQQQQQQQLNLQQQQLQQQQQQQHNQQQQQQANLQQQQQPSLQQQQMHQQLLMLRNLQMQHKLHSSKSPNNNHQDQNTQKQQPQQPNIQSRPQDQQHQQNQQQMTLNYLQAQQRRLGLTQSQMMQFMQQNMGNNAQMNFGNSVQMSMGNNAQMAMGNNAQMSMGNSAQMATGNSAQMATGNSAQMPMGNNAQMTLGNNAQMHNPQQQQMQQQNQHGGLSESNFQQMGKPPDKK